MESWIFLFVILISGFLSSNKSIIYPTIFIIVLKILPFSSKFLNIFRQRGLNLGVMVITAAILTPIAVEEIGFKHLLNAFKSPLGWVAISSGLFVSLLSANGVYLLSNQPELTITLIIGTIIGVTFFNGVAVGPLIAGGIAYFILEFIKKLFNF